MRRKLRRIYALRRLPRHRQMTDIAPILRAGKVYGARQSIRLLLRGVHAAPEADRAQHAAAAGEHALPPSRRVPAWKTLPGMAAALSSP